MSGKTNIQIRSLKVEELPRSSVEESIPQLYVSVQLGKSVYKTELKSCRSPNFSEVFEFPDIKVSNKTELIFQVVYKYSDKTEDILGSFSIFVSTLDKSSGTISRYLQRENDGSKKLAQLTFEYNLSNGKFQEKKQQKASLPATLSRASSSDPRPWFLRATYYYETTKKVYKYTTGLPVVSLFAKYGENTANYILSKIPIKAIQSTDAIDQSVVPLLQDADAKVDDGIAEIIQILQRGQEEFLNKKNQAQDKVTDVAIKTKNMAVNVKDKTVNTVSNAATTAYTTATGMAFVALSHVPILGKRFEVKGN